MRPVAARLLLGVAATAERHVRFSIDQHQVGPVLDRLYDDFRHSKCSHAAPADNLLAEEPETPGHGGAGASGTNVREIEFTQWRVFLGVNRSPTKT